MKLYLALNWTSYGKLISIMQHQGFRALVSFHKPYRTGALFGKGFDVFIDSGGFSAFTQGVEINIDQYCAWIMEHMQHITVYALLDAIGDHAKTMSNLRYMEKKGLTPLPVFHLGSDLSGLRAMVKDYSYIALGGLVPIARNRPRLARWLDRCFDVIRLDCKVHGFGMTGPMILERYPWFSCDSTSWVGGAMRAEIYDFNSGKMTCRTSTDKSAACHKSLPMSDDGDKRHMARLYHNAKQWKAYERYLTALWSKRGITWND